MAQIPHVLAVVALAVCMTGMTTVDASIYKNCKPPEVIDSGKPLDYFVVGVRATIPCVAQGNATLVYEWFKNGEPLQLNSAENVNRMTLIQGVGTLSINKPQEGDSGYYQCRVTNRCGTSVSLVAALQHARASPFPLQEKATKEVKALIGNFQKLGCKPPPSNPEALVTWILANADGNEIDLDDIDAYKQKLQSVTLDDRVTTDYEGNLYIINVRKEDEQPGKKYVCQVENVITRSSNKGDDKILKVVGDVKKTGTETGVTLEWNSADNIIGVADKKVKMKCIFSGNPLPIITWFRVDGQFDEKRTNRNHHELIIKNLVPSDTGRYKCVGRNKNNEESHTFNLTVDSKPAWDGRPRQMVVGPNETAVFKCNAKGQPKPEVEWYINGKPYGDLGDTKNRILKDNTLTFTNLKQEDSQVIQCNISNIHGYEWADAYLYVEAVAPNITNRPRLRDKVAEGQDLHIKCTVWGRPKPKVSWYKGGQDLVESRHQVQENGDLIIKNVKKEDSGPYKCFASNTFGRESAQGDIEVREKTEIVQEPMDRNVTSSEDVVFSCGAVTDPKESKNLVYEWLKDGKPLPPSPRYVFSTGKLTVLDTTSKDSGNYTCRAKNGLDSDSASAVLRVKAVPDPPINAEAPICQPRLAKITWEFKDEMSNFQPLQKFIVESKYSVESFNSSWKEVQDVPPTDREATLKISPYAEYLFRVRATNAMGTSKPSRVTTPVCKTVPSIPDKNPDNVHTDEQHTGYLVIKWDPMSEIDINGKNFTYVVEAQKQGEVNLTSFKVEDYKVGEKWIEVDDIYQPYTVKVRAENSVGKAMEAPQSFQGFSGEGVPLVSPENFDLDPPDPKKSVNATTAHFRWDAVNRSVEAMQGKFSGYKIRFWKVGEKETTMHAQIIEAEPEAGSRRRRRQSPESEGQVRGTVSNLPSFSEIEVDVVAINQNFESNGSNVITINTPEGVPDVVEKFEVISRGSHHLLLQWRPPSKPNGIITQYQVSYRKVIGIDLEPLVKAYDNLSPETRRVTLRGLEPASSYQIYISASTKIDTGKEYQIDASTHSDSAAVAQPVILEVIAGETDANITYDILDHSIGSRLGQLYKIQYKEKKERDWQNHDDIIRDGQRSVSLTHLEPNTQYQVRVLALPHDKGLSTPSELYTFKTSGVGATQATFLTAGWFIGMMIAIAILLILLIIVCIIKRNRGDNYPVQEKERLRGTYDEQPDLFNGFGKPEENGLGGSAGSLDQEKLPLDAESDSLDYGDDDASKFNEDGSFIGQYGRGEKGGDPANASSIV